MTKQLNISYDSKDFKLRLLKYCEARSCSDCALGAYSIHCFALLPEVLDCALKCAYGKNEVLQ